MKNTTSQTFSNTDYKIATWSITNNDGENSFLSKTHLTRDGVKTCCGVKITDNYGQRTVVAATARDIVNGKAQYLQAGAWHDYRAIKMAWLLDDLREAKCCAKCEAATGNWVSFTIDAIIAFDIEMPRGTFRPTASGRKSVAIQ